MFEAALKKVGRIQHVLIKKYKQTFITLEIVDEQHLLWGFLEPCKRMYASGCTATVAFEFDVEPLYPNIRRQRVLPAYRNLDKRMKKWKTSHGGSSKHTSPLQRVGPANWMGSATRVRAILTYIPWRSSWNSSLLICI